MNGKKNNMINFKKYAKEIIYNLSPETKKLNPPNTLFLEVTNICNARCTFCAYKTAIHPKGFMSFETFKKAIDEYTELTTGTISLTPTTGDPLLDKGLMKKIEYAKSKKIKKIYFYTNGILLNQDKNFEKLIDLKVDQINISMPQPDKESYKRIYQVDQYENVIDGLEKLLIYNKSKFETSKIIINFRNDCTKKEIESFPDFKERIKPYLSNKVNLGFLEDYDNWGGKIKQEELTGTMKLRPKPFFKSKTCIRMFDLMILYNGMARICACRFTDNEFDELVIGDNTKESISTIWYGEKARQARESFSKNNLLPVCKDCTLYLAATENNLFNHQNA